MELLFACSELVVHSFAAILVELQGGSSMPQGCVLLFK